MQNSDSGDRTSEAGFDLDQVDRLLTTTRAVRKRLDFDRWVSDELIFECIDLAEQAPTGGNDASRRWIVIRDQDLKDRLGELYAEVGTIFINARGRLDGTGHPKEHIVSSSAYLVENYAKAPALVMLAIWGIHDNSGRPGLFDSAIPSAWSFNLALRSRGLGTAYATMLNNKSDEVAELLGMPPGLTTLVCFPVAYTTGTEFSPAPRRPASEITYFDQWGYTRQRPSADGTARVADGQGVVVEIDTDARPRAVWEVISDINMPAQFSEEFLGAEWTSAGDPGVGSTFAGRNSIPDVFDWETDCIVTAWEERTAFEWRVTDTENPGAVWRFDLAEQGGGSRLRFSMLIGQENNGTVPMALRDPAKEQRVLNRRRQVLRANMQRVVEGVKTIVDGG
ncbi:nitroreductase family protein [Candidatus Poriferisodalis sp.]|uniref:nitroreductase family protein n=1 Tax=Candidatus Poriferisodalis sp. TaxID=3101277 RepID=UPI003B025F31